MFETSSLEIFFFEDSRHSSWDSSCYMNMHLLLGFSMLSNSNRLNEYSLYYYLQLTVPPSGGKHNRFSPVDECEIMGQVQLQFAGFYSPKPFLWKFTMLTGPQVGTFAPT